MLASDALTLSLNLTRFPSNFTVRFKDLLDDVYADLSKLFKSCGNVCGIVYCLERNTCDELSAHLSKNGICSAGDLQFFFISPAKNFSCDAFK